MRNAEMSDECAWLTGSHRCCLQKVMGVAYRKSWVLLTESRGCCLQKVMGVALSRKEKC